MEIRLSAEVVKYLKKLKTTDTLLFYRIQKTVKILQKYPSHPSLRLHRLSGKIKNRWSVSVSMSIRMIYIQTENEAYIVDIGTHEQVYKRK